MSKPYSRSPGLRWCRQWAGLASLLVLLTGPAQADEIDLRRTFLSVTSTSSSHELANVRQYGNCVTATAIDLFTDYEGYVVTCREETLTDLTEIAIITRPGGHSRYRPYFVTLSKGIQFHMNRKVPVAIRVDKGQVIKRSAQWANKSSHAHIDETALAKSLLDDLARGQRVVIRVGDESGTLSLDGSAQAIQDFKRRAGLISQQTLTPQQRQVLEIPSQ